MDIHNTTTLRVRSYGAALIFAICGTMAILVALDLPMGSLRRIGPGVFPFGIGLVLLFFGIVLVLVREAPPQRTPFKATMLIYPSMHVLAILVFLATIKSLGLVAAVALTTILASLAERSRNVVEILMLSAFNCLFCYAVFGLILKLPMPLFWWN